MSKEGKRASITFEEIKVEGNNYDTDSSVNDDCENPSVNPVDWKHENFEFVENDLFYFLNSTLAGQILLGLYKKTGSLDYTRLKRLIIYDEIQKDPVKYKIRTDVFVRLRDQASELFPTEDPDRFFVASIESKNDKPQSARGSFYNFYKVVRKELRDAGMLK